MIIRIEDLKNISSTVLSSISSNSLMTASNILEVASRDKNLILKISTGESLIEIIVPQDEVCDLNATVDAEMFFKLIEKTTSSTIELSVDNNCLKVRSNGVYKFPIIYNRDQMIHCTDIEIPTVTASSTLNTDILYSIYRYNSREVGKTNVVNPIQKLYYVDQEGCITFTQGACINNFHLDSPLQVLLSEKIVKLFKLFEPNTSVTLEIGPYPISEEIIQTRMRLKSDSIIITAILFSNEQMINSIPIDVIREMAQDEYPYNIVVNKANLLNALNRLILFSEHTALNTFGIFTFQGNKLKIEDINKVNYEDLIIDSSNIADTSIYKTTFDLVEWKNKLSSCISNHVTVKIGNNKAGLLLEKNIIYIIPECSENE